jgi:hypothetical protein
MVCGMIGTALIQACVRLRPISFFFLLSLSLFFVFLGVDGSVERRKVDELRMGGRS